MEETEPMMCSPTDSALGAQLCLLLSCLLCACGAARERYERALAVAAAMAPAPLCRFEGEWSMGTLRAPIGGFEAVYVSEGHARASLDAPRRLNVQVSEEGWHFTGFLDLARDDELRVQQPTWLTAAVAFDAGAAVRVLDARPGTVQIGPLPGTRVMGEAFRWAEPPAGWVRCEALGFAGVESDEETARRALGFPAEMEGRFIVPERAAPLSTRPGGPAFLEIAPREHPVHLWVVQAHEGFTRVLLSDWTGARVVGWTEAANLSPSSGPGGVFGVLRDRGRRTYDVCVSVEGLPLYASAEGSPPEPIGGIDPGTRFVRRSTAEDGTVAIGPHPSAPFHVPEGTAWLVKPRAPLSCHSYDPYPPATTLAVRATLTASNLEALPAGTTCAFEVEHWPGAHFSCRATVRCGEQVVFGASPTNGYFECELSDGDDPFVRGTDPETSADPALILDTRAGTMTLDDDTEGELGAFHLEARIDSVQSSD